MTSTHLLQTAVSSEEDFLREWPDWEATISAIKRTGLIISKWQIRRRGTKGDRLHSWLLWVQPTTALKNHFELAPELLLLLAPWNKMQMEDIAFVERQIADDLRVDRGLVFVVHAQRDAATYLAPTIPPLRKYVFLHFSDLIDNKDPQLWLRTQMQAQLGALRLFDYRQPAEDTQFFGRREEILALERKLLAGICVGIWGLRKIGKTSLVHQLLKKYSSAEETKILAPVLVDLTSLPWNDRDMQSTVALICRGASETEKRRGVTKAVAHFDEWIDQQPGCVVLALDEYERLLDGAMPVKDGLRLLEWLRGLVQRSAKKFSIVLMGRDPTKIAEARIGGTDNPMYRFLADEPLAGLDQNAANSMVRKIGRRMGLDFGHEATALIFSETGGHPMLTRSLGDAIDRSVTLEQRTPFTVDRSVVEHHLAQFLRDASEDFKELLTVAKELDPTAESLLLRAAHTGEFHSDPQAQSVIDRLTRWGILQRLSERSDAVTFRIGAFATWIRENKLPALAAE